MGVTTKGPDKKKSSDTFRKNLPRGTWVAQLVKRPTLGFGSGHDLTVRKFKPRVGLCADSAEPAWDPLSLSLLLPLSCLSK